jgi:nicotinic acid phosphoribosyltransferase
MELPKTKTSPTTEDAKFLILFGKQKCGKTTALASLDDNLIVDLEDGTDYLDALRVKVDSFEKLSELSKALRAELERTGKKPYKRITFDTATMLEDIILPYAQRLYNETPMGKGFGLKKDGSYEFKDVTKLPQGAGYLYAREAFKNTIDAFTKYCDTLILSAHVVDKQVEKNGKEVTELEMSLVGKLKSIMGARADAIGYVYRDKNKTVISFKGGEGTISESRPRHLSGKDIVVAESVGQGEDMEITFYWDRIFKNL